MCKIVIGLLAAFLAGCGGQDMGISPDAGTQSTLDPLGNWTLTYMIAADSCGNPATNVAQTITVVKTASGYGLVAGSYNASGTMTCTASQCTLSAVLTGSGNGINSQLNDTLTLKSDGKITGGGSGSASNGTQTCTGNFTVVGVLVR